MFCDDRQSLIDMYVASVERKERNQTGWRHILVNSSFEIDDFLDENDITEMHALWHRALKNILHEKDAASPINAGNILVFVYEEHFETFKNLLNKITIASSGSKGRLYSVIHELRPSDIEFLLTMPEFKE